MLTFLVLKIAEMFFGKRPNTTCYNCHGTGNAGRFRCPVCDGTGFY